MRRMMANGECYDNRTGEVNATGLAEGAADELDWHDCLDDYTHEIWDWAVEVAEARQD